MNQIINILNTKNRVLEKFHRCSIECVEQLVKGNFDKLPVFERRREKLINAVGLYDKKIEEIAIHFPEDEKTEKLKAEIQFLLDKKDKIVYEILAIDDRMLELIMNEQKKIKKDISKEKSSSKILSKFKSQQSTASGESLDKTL